MPKMNVQDVTVTNRSLHSRQYSVKARIANSESIGTDLSDGMCGGTSLYFAAFFAGQQEVVDGPQTQSFGQQQLQEDGQRHAALMQSLKQAAAAGMGPPMMHLGRAPGMPGQQGLPMQQVSSCFSS